MFFSIIIPTYNPKKYLAKALQAIATNKCIDNIEVIISDDISTEPFDDVLAQFPMLHIKVIQNDKHYGFPRPGRQHGLEEAQGEWICFQDQDDTFCDQIFDTIYHYIKQKDIHHVLYGNVNFIHDDGSAVTIEATDVYTHGKFFEKKFLEANKISYTETRYSEDIIFTRKLMIALVLNDLSPNILNTFVYNWMQVQTSLSHTKNYTIIAAADTMQYTFGLTTSVLNTVNLNVNQVYRLYDICMHDILLFYFFTQTAKNDEEKAIFDKYVRNILVPYAAVFIKALDIDVQELKDILTSNIDEYNVLRITTSEQTPFIEYMTIYDWMDKYFAPLV